MVYILTINKIRAHDFFIIQNRILFEDSVLNFMYTFSNYHVSINNLDVPN
jgi:hypothetical protein